MLPWCVFPLGVVSSCHTVLHCVALLCLVCVRPTFYAWFVSPLANIVLPKCVCRAMCYASLRKGRVLAYEVLHGSFGKCRGDAKISVAFFEDTFRL